MHKLKCNMEEENGFVNKLQRVLPQLIENLQIHDLYYVLSDNRMHSVKDKTYDQDASDISKIMKEDLFMESSLDLVKKHSPIFYDALMQKGFESVLISSIRKGNTTYGYLICAVQRSLRIWQENECAVLYYLSDLLADELSK